MARPALTTADARDMDHGDLIERIESILEAYDPPQVETQGEKLARINRTLDEMPIHYRWLLQLFSWCDHWTDAAAEMWGMKDRRYKAQRERRDLFEKQASAAKLRYEAASRLVTIMQEFAPDGMPRSRSGSA